MDNTQEHSRATFETTCFLVDTEQLRDPPTNVLQCYPRSLIFKPWEVLELDIHDMGARSEAGDKYLLVIVDRASKFLFEYPLPNKTADNVAKTLLSTQ